MSNKGYPWLDDYDGHTLGSLYARVEKFQVICEELERENTKLKQVNKDRFWSFDELLTMIKMGRTLLDKDAVIILFNRLNVDYPDCTLDQQDAIIKFANQIADKWLIREE